MVFSANAYPSESSYSVNGGPNSGTMVEGDNECLIDLAVGAHTFSYIDSYGDGFNDDAYW